MQQNPNYKDGKCLKDYFCKDCFKKISLSSGIYGQSRCGSCNIKYLFKTKKLNTKGQNNANYKNGKYTLNPCIDCGTINKSKMAKRCSYCYLKIFRNLITSGRISKYNKIYFLSTWEANFAKWCDLSGIKYEYEKKRFLVKLKNKDSYYKPDFYLPEFDCWIEIKGYWHKGAKKKFNKFKKQYSYINIKIFDKIKLLNYGVIK